MNDSYAHLSSSEVATSAGSEYFFPDGTRKIMRLFICYESERRSLEVPVGKTVAAVKKMVQDLFLLDPNQAQLGDENQEKNSLVLSYYGAELPDHWQLSDLGITAGSSLRAYVKEELDPVFYFFVAYNQETIPVMDRLKLSNFSVADLRGMASRRTGLPVSVFRLIATNKSSEMFDCHLLEEYAVKPGDTFRLETWDGWNNFLTLCSLGFTSHVLSKIVTNDDILSRFQSKVALYMAAHFGHVDLAVTLMGKMNCRSDEPVGDHPYRQWCNTNQHVDTLKAPVHEAVEAGQLSVLRTFVHQNVCCIMSRDGNGLQPLNIALRLKRKECASFLLTKQWSRINYGANSIPLAIFSRMKSWSERAREKVQLIFGPEKSSNKKKVIRENPLVGQGIYIDGYSTDTMCSRSKASGPPGFRFSSNMVFKDNENRMDPEEYFKGLSQVTTRLLPKQQNKWSRMSNMKTSQSMAALNVGEKPGPTPLQAQMSLPHFATSTIRTIEENEEIDFAETGGSPENDNKIRLPPIVEKQKSMRHFSIPSDNLNTLQSRRGSRGDFDMNMDDNRTTTSGMAILPNTDEKHPRKKQKKVRDTLSAQLLAKAKATEGSIPLPLNSVEDTPRPFFFVRPGEKNLAQEAIEEYEKYRGMDARNYAIQCLSVSNVFRKKPWLSQVRLAMDLTVVNVKKPVNSHHRQPISLQPLKISIVKDRLEDDDEEENELSDLHNKKSPRLAEGLSQNSSNNLPSVRSGTTH